MVVVSISSLKVKFWDIFVATDEAESEGKDVETFGTVVSLSVVVSLSTSGAVASVMSVVDPSSTSVQELKVNVKIMERIMRIYLKELPVSGLEII
jgi:hypothetical protein